MILPPESRQSPGSAPQSTNPAHGLHRRGRCLYHRFPALSKLVLRQGAVEFDPDIPGSDITLLATSAALVVRADLNPSLASLLAYAVLKNPKSGFDSSGEPILFYRAGEFPNGNDPEFELSPEARLVYQNGEPPISCACLPSQQAPSFTLLAFGRCQWGLRRVHPASNPSSQHHCPVDTPAPRDL